MFDEEADVVCVGSGAGGLCTAIACAQGGLRAVVVEKSECVGGITGQSGGQLWVGGVADSIEPDSETDALAYLDALAMNRGDRTQRELLARRAKEAMHFYRDAGLELSPVPGLPDYYYPIAPGSRRQGRVFEHAAIAGASLGKWRERVPPCPSMYMTSEDRLAMCAGEDIGPRMKQRAGDDVLCGGPALAGSLILIAERLGVAIHPATRAVELIDRAGRVEGVIVEQAGERRRIAARRGVLLATGGYDWNRDMVSRYDGISDLRPMSLPTLEGDFRAMAARLGAAFAQTDAPLRTFGCALPPTPGETGSRQGFLSIGLPHCLVVNDRAERFCDESFSQDYRMRVAEVDGTLLRLRNWPAWLIFDQTYVDRYGVSSYPPGAEIDDAVATRANSLGELARAIGIDGQRLTATVARFNGMCETGVDEDFHRGRLLYTKLFFGDMRHRPNPNLGPLSRAPFYALKLVRLGTGFSCMGMTIDLEARVLDVAGRPIPGLYAAGNCVALTELPVGGYNSGIANARGMMHGYLAARDMMARDATLPAG